MINGPLPLILAALLNVWIAAGWFIRKDPAMGIIFVCYAIATLGFLYKMTYP